jgi:hypothetical protein
MDRRRLAVVLAALAITLPARGARLEPRAVASTPQKAAPPAARPTGDASLLPPDAAVAGWKKVENLRVFASADLYGYIDGGAELFLEFGFDQLTLQKYRSGANEFAVELYRMRDPAAATGIYLMKCGKEARNPAFPERHTINRHQLMFVRERFFVTVNNLSGVDGMMNELVRFGALVASKLPADRVLAELQRLPAAGLVPGSQRLVRGPFSLQALYTLGDGDILQLGGRLVGVAGNYADSGNGLRTLLIVTYPDAVSARAAFANVRQNLDKYLKPTATTPARLVFKDYENKFGIVSLEGARIDVNLHLTTAR